VSGEPNFLDESAAAGLMRVEVAGDWFMLFAAPDSPLPAGFSRVTVAAWRAWVPTG
jgi:hypothetical protein